LNYHTFVLLFRFLRLAEFTTSHLLPVEGRNSFPVIAGPLPSLLDEPWFVFGEWYLLDQLDHVLAKAWGPQLSFLFVMMSFSRLGRVPTGQSFMGKFFRDGLIPKKTSLPDLDLMNLSP